MELGYRVFDSQLIRVIDLSLVQISVFRTSEADIQRARILAELIKAAGKRYVIHPMDVRLSDINKEVREFNLKMVKRYAEMADLGLIIHDELMPDGRPLEEEWQECFHQGLADLENICPVSLENARDSHHAIWFWQTFAKRITFDIGHFQSSRLDSLKIINSMQPELVKKIDYVHLHHSNGLKPNGLIDHWPLIQGCPEVLALRRLLELKAELKVILELDTLDDVMESRRVLMEESFL